MRGTPWPLLIGAFAVVCWLNGGLLAEEKADSATTPVPGAPADTPERVPVEVARDRAKLMHRVYAATLDVMHDRYFHGDRAMVPARAMEDVFMDVARGSEIKARWISVNTKAMSLNHEPKSEFEKQVAKRIGDGEESVETTDQGYYWRAAAIPLGDGCISCHTGFFTGPPKSPRYAALIIGMPIREK
jgi:hypothetical protein